ncbi:MAG: DNA cytosine methyltransferase [Brucella sp.]
MSGNFRTIDLFSGCGGMALGAELAGFHPALAVDVDQTLSSSYFRNFPRSRHIAADLADVSGEELLREAGARADILFGGPPCQAFSSIGKRDPLDPRRDLLSHFFRIVSEAQPMAFVMENVKGLAFKESKHLLDTALSNLNGNYTILGPLVFDASDFGAATKRERLFVIGFKSQYVENVAIEDFNAERAPLTTVQEAIADLGEARSLGIESGYDQWQLTDSRSLSQYAAAMRSADATTTGLKPTNHTVEVVERFALVQQGAIDKVGRHPRLSWSGLCPTLRAGTGADRGSYQSVRPIHPTENRVITPREGARLQGFPDRFLFHPTVWHSFRMIGNSVSPIMAKSIFSVLRRKMEI